jgi:hypothetical protein
MAGKKKMFIVTFQRLGPNTNIRDYFEAESVGALEAPIQEFVDDWLTNQHTTITINPVAMSGQIDYGLKGEFTIVAS